MNMLLIYIPIGDIVGINFCLSSAVEKLLKFVYSKYCHKKKEAINKTSFRHMKDDLEEIDKLSDNEDLKIF